jgi:acetyl-CoA carboxylase carboxyltransferase component/biotin carboxyl carrier protein
MGLDLVETQIRLLEGASLEDLGLTKLGKPRGFAIQARVNAETMDSDGQVKPAGGVIAAYEAPSGPGVRVDGAGYAGYAPNPNFDSLLAKVIVHARAGGAAEAASRLARALEDFRLGGAPTNIALLANILRDPNFAAGRMTTRYLEQNVRTLTATQAVTRHFASNGAVATSASAAPEVQGPENTIAVRAPLQSTLVSLGVGEGDAVTKGQIIAVVEALKMEHTIEAPESGIVRLLASGPGQIMAEGAPVLFLEPGASAAGGASTPSAIDLDAPRADLAELNRRLQFTLTENRADAVERRRKTGMRMARENIDDLFDKGSFIEIGALTVAGQRRRRDIDDLMRNTPGDGMIAGFGSVNGKYFDEEKARCMGLAYDYTVLAGTQGSFNHRKTDRTLKIAQEWKLPVVWYCEGGGGRPGDTEGAGSGGGALSVPTFETYAALSGLAPRIGIAAGRCFAGNAVMFGLSDITIATKNCSIGLGGPAMIEGGGLGVYHPDEIGPIDVQTKNGVVDVAVEDEAEATRVAKQVLSYFQGSIKEWTCADQRLLRHAVPENRLRVFDVREIIRTLSDEGWFTELRPDFGIGMITGFVRIEGRPFGLIANNCKHLSGAIDADGADKAARMFALCDAFDLPIISLCDTPGYIVGPETERAGAVRHGVRMYAIGSNVDVPVFTIVLRKGYGLGAMAMAQGRFDKPVFTISWPTGEFGGMGLEGAARLGNRRELEAIADPDERKAFLDRVIAASYERGQALNQAQWLQLDAVIDPADTRAWLMRGIKSMPKPPQRVGKKRPWVDTW